MHLSECLGIVKCAQNFNLSPSTSHKKKRRPIRLIRSPSIDGTEPCASAVLGKMSSNPQSRQVTPNAFMHTPLDQERPSIRLIQLKPQLSPDGYIQCKMFHADTKATYKCLSYTWGDQESIWPLLINGQMFRVRQNLFDFLQVARKKTRRIKSIWIDALCIDQANTFERNHQVQHMGEIYSHAKEVVVWLEDRNSWLRLEFQFLQAKSLFSRTKPDNPHGDARAYKDGLKSYFYSNPYWRRAWVRRFCKFGFLLYSS